MKNIFELVDESGIVLTADVLREGFTKPSFYKFIKDNGFEQVAHGVYASQAAWADENYILSLRCPQAVFSDRLRRHGIRSCRYVFTDVLCRYSSEDDLRYQARLA